MIAFFPCIRFENQAKLHFRCDAPQYAKYTMVEKLEHNIRLQKQLSELYDLVSMLAIIAYRRGLRLIIENPYSKEHYLHSYWCLKPTIIDYDRRENGDYFKKPTQYFFINIEPKQNVLFEAIKQMQINDTRDAIRQISNVGIIENLPVKSFTHRKDQTARSMISAQYANRFIRQYIL